MDDLSVGSEPNNPEKRASIIYSAQVAKEQFKAPKLNINRFHYWSSLGTKAGKGQGGEKGMDEGKKNLKGCFAEEILHRIAPGRL